MFTIRAVALFAQGFVFWRREDCEGFAPASNLPSSRSSAVQEADGARDSKSSMQLLSRGPLQNSNKKTKTSSADPRNAEFSWNFLLLRWGLSASVAEQMTAVLEAAGLNQERDLPKIELALRKPCFSEQQLLQVAEGVAAYQDEIEREAHGADDNAAAAAADAAANAENDGEEQLQQQKHAHSTETAENKPDSHPQHQPPDDPPSRSHQPELRHHHTRAHDHSHDLDHALRNHSHWQHLHLFAGDRFTVDPADDMATEELRLLSHDHRACTLPGTHLQPSIAIAVSTTSRFLNISGGDFRKFLLFATLLPSFVQTAERGFRYWWYVGFDKYDNLFDRPRQLAAMRDWFDEHVTRRLARHNVSACLHLNRLNNYRRKPGYNFNL